MATIQASSAEEFVLNIDPRAMPRYTPAEAARYLGLPESTIRAWFFGMPTSHHWFAPFLAPASHELLSFYDMASAHVLLAMKRYGVSADDLRGVVESLRVDPRFDPRYPLLGRQFYMWGKKVVRTEVDKRVPRPKVVTKEHGKRLVRSRQGSQYAFKEVLDRFLSRLDLDKDKMPLRIRPLRTVRERGRGFIVIDPKIAAGSPVVVGTGIMAEVIAKRKKSGESETRLAKDYRISRRAVQEAIKYYEAA